MIFSKCIGPRHVRERLRQSFKFDRHIFDKSLRKAERQYNHNIVQNLENISTDNTREFWAQILKIGRKQNEYHSLVTRH